MATAKTITAFKYRTEVIADIAKHTSEFKKADETVEKYGKTIQKVAKDTSKAFDGAAVGRKFGSDVGTSAVAALGNSFNLSTLGSIIGTAIGPGIGTAVGSSIGSALDTALGKAMGPVLDTIKKGIDLNELLEQTQIEFTTFAGSEKEAKAYLADLLKMSTDLGILPAVLIDSSEKTYDLTSNLKLTRTILKAAADQAADFGGKVETFQAIADTLGLIAEKGDLAGRELNKLYKLGIDAKKRLAEATGLTEKDIGKMIAQGRVRGDVAARLIAESIEREKGGYAQRQAMTSTAGARHRFEALSQVSAAEGTQNATHTLGDFYRTANDVLSSPQAQQFVKFLDEKTGSLINMVEKASRAGINVSMGVGAGLTSPESLQSLGASLRSFGDFTENTFKDIFEIKSPSERMAREIGVPLGQGIAQGIILGFVASAPDISLRERLEKLIDRPNFMAFVKALASQGFEGGDFTTGYGGSKIDPSKGLAGVPGRRGPSGKMTHAFGIGQFQPGTYRNAAQALGMDPNDLSPKAQLMVEAYLLHKLGVLDHVINGEFEKAISARGMVGTWTSLPGGKEAHGNTVAKFMSRLAGQQGMSMPTGAAAPSGELSDVAAWKGAFDSLTPEDRAQMHQLGTTIKETMDRIAGIDVEIRAAEKELQGARPGAGQPHGGQAEYNAAFTLQRLKETRDTLLASLQQLNQENQQLIQIAVTNYRTATRQAQEEIDQRRRDEIAFQPPPLNPDIPAARPLAELFQDLGVVLPDLASQVVSLETGLQQWATTTSVLTLGMPPLTKEMLDFGQSARAEFALTNEVLRQNQAELLKSIEMRSQLAAAIGQAGGMLPQQQVGKKRGIFSKILGIAAPFLSFIPGVGPMLSHLAGMASAGLAGNWAGVAGGLAQGLQPGGVFAGSGGGGSSGGGPGTIVGMGNGAPGHTTIRRAFGGPVYRGRQYIVGEHRAELFEPRTDGWIHPRADGHAPGGGSDPAMAAMLERLHGVLARMESMKPHDVVRIGARGYIAAMGQDAGLIRLSAQRHRLA